MTQPQTQTQKPKIIEALEKLRISFRPPKMIAIYGNAMIGKSTLSIMLAHKLAQMLGKTVKVIATEPTYDDPEYLTFIRDTTQADFSIVKLVDTKYLQSILAQSKNTVIVLDSLSTLVNSFINRFLLMGYDIRVANARAPTFAVSVVLPIRQHITMDKSIAIIVTHAGTTAGTGKYRGLTEYKPTFTARIAHYLDYELLMEINQNMPETRKLTVIAHRTCPECEGREIAFYIRKGDIEPLTPATQEEILEVRVR